MEHQGSEHQGSVVDTCEREVRRWILTGAMRPGDRLPPERALAARLGVNRTTLRSALTRLAAARLLHVRQGSGYVVQDFRRVGGLELLPDVVEDDDGRSSVSADLLALRRAILRTALLDLAGRPLDAAELGRTLARTLAAGDATDHEVTSRVVGAARTPVLALAFNPVALAIRAVAPIRDALDREARGLGWSLVSWLERPSREAIDALVGELEVRDRAVLAEPPPPSREDPLGLTWAREAGAAE